MNLLDIFGKHMKKVLKTELKFIKSIYLFSTTCYFRTDKFILIVFIEWVGFVIFRMKLIYDAY